MAILLDRQSRIVIQGITGSEGSFHTRESVKFGTKVVAGVTPGKGGTDLDGIPVYDRVGDAVEKHQANITGIYTPATFAPDAIFEAIEAGIGLIICMTEGIPVMEMIRVKQALKGSASPRPSESAGTRSWARGSSTSSSGSRLIRRPRRS